MFSRAVARITIGAFVGGAVGLVVGLVLLWLSVVENPFWAMSIGIAVGAASATTYLGRDGRG